MSYCSQFNSVPQIKQLLTSFLALYFSFSKISCKWKDVIASFFFFDLASFNKCFDFHPFDYMGILFTLCPNYCSLIIQYFCLYIYQSVDNCVLIFYFVLKEISLIIQYCCLHIHQLMATVFNNFILFYKR